MNLGSLILNFFVFNGKNFFLKFGYGSREILDLKGLLWVGIVRMLVVIMMDRRIEVFILIF